MTKLGQDTNGDPRLLAKLNLMHDSEPSMQEHIGISTAMRDYVLRAFSETKMLVYEKYLSPDEIRFMRANYVSRAMEWPELMADVRDAIDAHVDPASEEGIALARRWYELFSIYAGRDPKTHAKFRQAMEKEPELKKGTWVNEVLLAFVRQAMAAAFRPA